MRKGAQKRNNEKLCETWRKTWRPLRLKNKSLRLKKKSPRVQIIVVDELGPYELRGQGWAASMDHLLAHWQGPLIWVVRESLIDAMLQRWPARHHQVFHAGETPAESIVKHIRDFVKNAYF